MRQEGEGRRARRTTAPTARWATSKSLARGAGGRIDSGGTKRGDKRRQMLRILLAAPLEFAHGATRLNRAHRSDHPRARRKVEALLFPLQAAELQELRHRVREVGNDILVLDRHEAIRQNRLP